MYKLVISDLDGTLLDSKGEILDENIKAIKEINKKGIKFAILSGRQCKHIKEVVDIYELDCIIIGLNGGEFIDTSGNSICGKSIDKEAIIEVILMCEKENVIYQLYNNDNVITKELDCTLSEMIEFAKLHCDDTRGILDGALIYYDVIYNESIIKKNVIDYLESNEFNSVKMVVLSPDRRKLNELEISITNKFDLSVSASHISNIEITDININKGQAVKRIAEMLNIRTDEIIGIGDNLNDLPMLEKVGLSVAVGNASNELKSIVNYVSKTNNEAGVAYAINKFILD